MKMSIEKSANKFFVIYFATLTVTAACSYQRPTPNVGINVEIEIESENLQTENIPLPSSINIAQKSDSLVYNVSSVTELSQTSDDSTATGNISSHGIVKIMFERSYLDDAQSTSTIKASGSISEFKQDLLQNTDTVSTSISSVLFDATVSGMILRVAPRPVPANECEDNSDGVLSLVRALIPRIPAKLEPGISWTDTTRIFQCRSGIPITTENISTYIVDSIALISGEPKAHISGKYELSSNGNSNEQWRRLVLSGSGYGTSSFFVNAFGLVTDVKNNSKMEIRISDSSLPGFPVSAIHQSTNISAKLINP